MSAERDPGDRPDAAAPDAAIVLRSETDPQAFVLLFERHFDAIHRYVHRRLGRDLADDLAAEVFLRAFAARASFVPAHESALPWLYGIATNLVRRHRRTEVRQLRAYARSGIDVGVALDTEAIERRVDARADGPAIAAALAALRPREREVLVLVTFTELTTREAAAALGVPSGTVASRLHRARECVRAHLAATARAPSSAGPSPETRRST